MIVVKYQITKETITYSSLSNFVEKDKAQKYISYLSRKNSHGYQSVKTLKNSLLCKRQSNANGDIKFLYFKIITSKKIKTDTKDIIEIQKMC